MNINQLVVSPTMNEVNGGLMGAAVVVTMIRYMDMGGKANIWTCTRPSLLPSIPSTVLKYMYMSDLPFPPRYRAYHHTHFPHHTHTHTHTSLLLPP